MQTVIIILAVLSVLSVLFSGFLLWSASCLAKAAEEIIKNIKK
jgi:hypothetical protein